MHKNHGKSILHYTCGFATKRVTKNRAHFAVQRLRNTAAKKRRSGGDSLARLGFDSESSQSIDAKIGAHSFPT